MGNISNQLLRQKIYLDRGLRIMIDADLAGLYGVETFNLNKAVKRNIDRFPADFMFQLTREENELLTFQIGMSKKHGRGGRRTLPFVFTQEGVAMLSSVLNSKHAIKVNIEIMRAFVTIRELVIGNNAVSLRLSELEKKYGEHDSKFRVVFDAIREIMAPIGPLKKRRIGF